MKIKPVSKKLKPTTRFLLKARSSQEIHAKPKTAPGERESRKQTAQIYRQIKRSTGSRGADTYVKGTFGTQYRVNRSGKKSSLKASLKAHRAGVESRFHQ